MSFLQPGSIEGGNTTMVAEGCLDVPAFVDIHEVDGKKFANHVTFWKVTKEQALEIIESGGVYLHCLGQMPPVMIGTQNTVTNNKDNEIRTGQ